MLPAVLTSDFNYDLPEELVAQEPAAKRDDSRLMVLNRDSASITHRKFPDLLDYLAPGDVLVLNNSKVLPARLAARNDRTGGLFEVFLLNEKATNVWWTMMRPGKRARIGTTLRVRSPSGQPLAVQATVMEINAEGHRLLLFKETPDIKAELNAIGSIPVPPYIRRPDQTKASLDRERYQTVFATTTGSVAAPTAGLHFTDELLARIRSRGIDVCFVTLHVGLGTFAPVKAETVSAHKMHEEQFQLDADTVSAINKAKKAGRRVFAVGTTTVRVLESVAAANSGQLVPNSGRTQIFIYPPFHFRVVDGLVTNFHLPGSTLLMLVSAFCNPGGVNGREFALSAYAAGVKHRYRFFSYGDAMLIL